MTLLIGVHGQPKPVAKFNLSEGLNADIFPVRFPRPTPQWYRHVSLQDINTWVTKVANTLEDPLDGSSRRRVKLDSALRLTFKVPDTFWAFLYFASGSASNPPRHSLTGDICYMSEEDYEDFLSSNGGRGDFPAGAQRRFVFN